MKNRSIKLRARDERRRKSKTDSCHLHTSGIALLPEYTELLEEKKTEHDNKWSAKYSRAITISAKDVKLSVNY